MEEIVKGNRVTLGNVSGEILETTPTQFRIKFDEHTVNGESKVWYPNTLIHHLTPVSESEEKE